jgi:hypothetical protein
MAILLVLPQQSLAQFRVVNRLHLQEERHDEHRCQLAQDHGERCHEDGGHEPPCQGQRLQEQVQHDHYSRPEQSRQRRLLGLIGEPGLQALMGQSVATRKNMTAAEGDWH